MIVAFSVNVSRMADQAAAQNSIPVFSSKIIYSVLDEIKARIIKLLPPIIEKRVTGEANVLQLFDINGKGRSIIKVAGCRVSNGIVEKDKHVRVLRNGETIHEGMLLKILCLSLYFNLVRNRHPGHLAYSQTRCYRSEKRPGMRHELVWLRRPS